ncbi:wax ester synthase-like Acyl-CoA acyltransferase domain protein [Mycobacterium kansasii]|uniref:Wax ester synthase-like Acyl-CoA acyltransferase domain protein n=1 Tax=Mycobacterium kansasii TaxID=1768 RepID=A0A1V3WYX2_MYCKA|nr:wax ester synthase-like Acyl-CoA acyltransferase domain protein [Mycobacterium kansasii]
MHGRVTAMRRYHAARVRLADVREVAQAFGVTLNDVALAAITDSYRKLLLARGNTPAATRCAPLSRCRCAG